MNHSIYLTALLLLPTVSVLAQTAQEQGLEIAKKIDQRDSGWNDAEANMKMILKNRQGEESVRTLHIQFLEVEGDGDKSLAVFNDPSDIKNTAFLSFSHSIKPDDQWLYLPALKRVKRISSANKSGPFMGSEFAYEDLSSFEVDKYSYTFIREEKLDGHDTYVIESVPQYSFSGYTRLIAWIDTQRFIPLKAEYYDRKNDLLKTLTYSDYTQYLDHYWRAQKQIMINNQTGKTTLLTLSDFRFKLGLNDNDFNRNKLKRSR